MIYETNVMQHIVQGIRNEAYWENNADTNCLTKGTKNNHTHTHTAHKYLHHILYYGKNTLIYFINKY